jgi:hypothetical protein
MAAIAAYIRQPKKPRINLSKQELGLVLSFLTQNLGYYCEKKLFFRH